ncbi:MAG: 50S ribosomal protein L21e [Candidatus Bathyarchaeota archaeon]|nr:50S ribosomal protein L21e [Candidatus Bathyarchaeota archaeon]MDI6806152.1 50S ribosomal protein L21e [Candidatus Bathyarchaeia archaeon]
MKKSKGYRTRTRRLLKKKPRERGKIRISKLLHEYEPGSSVVIKIDPSVHKGMPHKRYHGKIGKIITKIGRSYAVSIAQGDAIKEIIVRPEHLEPYKSD